MSRRERSMMKPKEKTALREHMVEGTWMEADTRSRPGPRWFNYAYLKPHIGQRASDPHRPTHDVRFRRDGRQIPKYAWEDIHHRFEDTYANWCKPILQGISDGRNESTGKEAKTIIVRHALTDNVLTRLDCGFTDELMNKDNADYQIPRLTFWAVALELERWAKRTRRPGSEGIRAVACKFVSTDKGVMKNLSLDDSLRDICGTGNPLHIKVMFQWPKRDRDPEYTVDQWRTYEQAQFLRQLTMRNAIRALNDRSSLLIRCKTWNDDQKKWLWPWDTMEPHLQVWDARCQDCHRRLERQMVFCYSCSSFMCMECCVNSGWPSNRCNVLCDGCTRLVYDALID